MSRDTEGIDELPPATARFCIDTATAKGIPWGPVVRCIFAGYDKATILSMKPADFAVFAQHAPWEKRAGR